jgi:hypothetical protein
VTVNEAERIVRTTSARMVAVVREGQIEAKFLKVRRDGSRTECWIRRESLNQWIAGRDAELAAYIARPEAKQALGLTNTTIVAVAAAGVILISEALNRTFRHAVSISFVKTS